MSFDPISVALGALGGGGGSTEVSQSQSSNVSVVASPVVGITTGQGSASPSGGGSASGTPSASATATGTPSGGSLFGVSPFSSGNVNDLDDVQFASAGLGSLFSNPLILGAAALVAFLFFTQDK